MDDSRIRQLTEEVLSHVREDTETPALSSIEARVASLEAAVRELRASPASAQATGAAVPAIRVEISPSLQMLKIGGGSPEHCVLEPDKPCVQSGQCRSLGH